MYIHANEKPLLCNMAFSPFLFTPLYGILWYIYTAFVNSVIYILLAPPAQVTALTSGSTSHTKCHWKLPSPWERIATGAGALVSFPEVIVLQQMGRGGGRWVRLIVFPCRCRFFSTSTSPSRWNIM